MTDPLGLSLGATNLVAARTGHPPVSAPSPLAGVDGSASRGAEPAAAALDELGRRAGSGAPVWIAVPAHWGPDQREAVRTAVLTKPGLAPGGVAPVLVADAAAAVAALRAGPATLPTDGVVALCDFGGSGTSITLLDAAADFALISHTVRTTDFSGGRLDREIVNHLIATRKEIRRADSGKTTAIETLARLRDECRSAKERLSERDQTTIPVALPGFSGEVSLTRGELAAIAAPLLAGVARAVAQSLAGNRISPVNLAAVAAVGGAGAMPVIGVELSPRLRVPVITATQPGFAAATGAALLAVHQPTPGSMGRIRPTLTADLPTRMAPTAWAGRAAGAAAGDAAGGDAEATFRALAWSQDDADADEPVPYSEADYTDRPEPAEAAAADLDETGTESPGSLAWYKRPAVLLGLAAALALAATGGLAYTLTGSTGPAGTTTTITTSVAPSGADSPRSPTEPGSAGAPAPGAGTPSSAAPTTGSTTPSTPQPTTSSPTTTPSTTTTTSTPSTTTPTTTPATTTTSPAATTEAPSTTQPQPPTTAAPSTTAAPTEPAAGR